MLFMVNSGKIENKIEARLVNNEKDYLKFTSKPSYMSQNIFNNYLVAIHNSKVTLTLNKRVYFGMCILNFSKVLVYEFHYDFLKKKIWSQI